VVQHRAAEQGERRAERGFTLVEIMLAVSLLSIIVTVMYSAFHTIGRIMRKTEQTKNTYQSARLIMSRMRQDVCCAHFSPQRKNFIFKGEDMLEADGDADALTFVTAAHVISGRDVPEGDWAEVSYYLDEDNPGLLVRREDVSPDDNLEVGGVLDILGKDVVGLNFTYLDGTEEAARRVGGNTTDLDESLEEQSDWKDEWDTEETAYLPRAVRIDLSLLNEEGEVEDFSATIVLAMGRTATSILPTEQGAAGRAATPAPSGRGGRQPALLRDGPRRGEGDRRGRGERGREGVPRSTGGGRRTPSPGGEGIQRNVPNAAPGGMRPPTPRGRR